MSDEREGSQREVGIQKDGRAYEWYEGINGLQPREVVARLIWVGAEIRDFSQIDLKDASPETKLILWSPEGLGVEAGRRVFRLSKRYGSPVYGIQSFALGLIKKLRIPTHNGEDSLSLYLIPYPSTGNDLFSSEVGEVDEKKSYILLMREDQVKEVCDLIGVKFTP